MDKKVRSASRLHGEVTPPGDKSISHRAAILNSIALGRATVRNFLAADDCLSTLGCLRALGVDFTVSTGDSPTLDITGVGTRGFKEPEDVLNAGNSGTTLRLFAGLLAAQPFLSIMTGDASLRSRPLGRVVAPLKEMGAQIWGRDRDNHAPVAIRGGNLHGITYSLPVASAQLKSALLLAGLSAEGPTVLREPAQSRDHTERMLRAMGARLESEAAWLSLSPLTAALAPLSLNVPGDISSAAYWLVAAAVHPEARVRVTNVGVNPTRTGILDVLQDMGAKLRLENERQEGGEPVADIVVESSELRAVTVKGEIVPRLIDEVPVLAVAACLARGTTTIEDVGELRVKESDRIKNTVQELSRLGGRLEELPQGMIIHGARKLNGAVVSSHGDHRLAMMLAVAGSVARGETVIHDAGAVDISYPAFWRDMERLCSS
ncbi:MAG: 3-phosphoshikimate 1-carboxyvinyltransferase [Chloroflexi bacterium]|nr:3-phosphoshikimate 1-carboxyvinyltransferase [Chloroflexota bacterium]